MTQRLKRICEVSIYAVAGVALVLVLLLVGASGCATVPAPALVPYSEPVVSLDATPAPLPPYRSIVEIVQHNDIGASVWSWLDTVDLFWPGDDKTAWTKQSGAKEIPWPKDRYLVREIGRVAR